MKPPERAMVTDSEAIGYTLPEFAVEVSADRIAEFAAVVGDHACARAGVAPPTFLKVIEGENHSSRRMLDALGVDLKRVLHVEQAFDYLHPVLAGDSLKVERRVSDRYEKKGGRMEFITIETVFSRDELLVARSRQVILVRHPDPQVAG